MRRTIGFSLETAAASAVPSPRAAISLSAAERPYPAVVLPTAATAGENNHGSSSGSNGKRESSV